MRFTALIYAPAWLAATKAEDAPQNDQRLHYDLIKYRSVDPQIADAAFRVVRRHTWYLRPETVTFALFSDRVDSTTKQEMAQKISELPVIQDSLT